MSYDGSGTFNTINTFVYDTVISETDVNANFADVATGLSTAITKDGQTTITADIPFATKKITGLGDGTAKQDAAAVHQIQDQKGIWCGTAGGTKNALTLTPSPAITAYAAGQSFTGVIGGTSSDDVVTLAVSGLTAKDVQIDGAALSASIVLTSGKIYRFDYDGAQFQATRLSTTGGLVSADIGVTVQGYDAATVKTNVAPNFTVGINEGRGSVAMHATTMDLWAQPNIIDGTGSAVPITAIANAPQAGATRTLYAPVGTVITNNAMFAVDGGADYTTAAGQALIFEAVTTSTYKVHILTEGRASADIASATTVDLTAARGKVVVITGTTTTTALTMNTGQEIILLPSGAWPLTYNATTMNINGGVSYTCAAGDRLYCTKDLAGVIRVSVIKQDGTPLVSSGATFYLSSSLGACAANTRYQATHGLGARPSSFGMLAVCNSADFGYSVGDAVNNPQNGDTRPFGCVSADATILNYSSAANTLLQLVNKTTPGDWNSATASKWNVYLWAIA